jgi:hypothetical protein
MNFKELVEGITPDIYEGLKRGVEIGKWPDGRSLTEEQKILCMQAIIAYEESMPEDQRTGYVPPKVEPCDIPDEVQPLSWKN